MVSKATTEGDLIYLFELFVLQLLTKERTREKTKNKIIHYGEKVVSQNQSEIFTQAMP